MENRDSALVLQCYLTLASLLMLGWLCVVCVKTPLVYASSGMLTGVNVLLAILIVQ